MPGMTGDHLVQPICEIQPTLSVILYTGSSERLSQEKTTAPAIGAVLEKPVTLRRLAFCVRQVFDLAGEEE